ncbi:MAG TPA: response regulator transcription factor [Clostridia bacterium]|nr:response regulator transcription factor [Clostridia bacterium]
MQVVIADDQPIIRQGLKMILELDENLHFAGEAGTGVELMEFLNRTPCDVVLMDIRMPQMDGMEATLRVKNRFPKTKVLILTTFEDDEYIFHCLKNGADGYLLKDADPDEIIRAIYTVNSGNILLHPKITTKVVSALNAGAPITAAAGEEPPELLLLTAREREVAELVAQGKSNRDIAAVLFVAEGTVKNHLTKVLDKLSLKSRNELIVYMTKVTGGA